MPRVAILIPAYNAEKTIAETLDAIQFHIPDNNIIQTIYIADDKSVDRTLAICDTTWSHKSIKLVKLSHQINLGERGNVNRSLAMLSKDYDWILLLHADDLIKDAWLNKMYQAIIESSQNVASISSSYDVLHIDGRLEAGENRNGYSVIRGNPNSVKSTLLKGTWWHISGCAINLKIFFHSGTFHEAMPQYGDMEWILRILNMNYDIIYIPQALTVYRQHQTSVSSNSFKKHLDIYELANLIVYYKNLFNRWDFFKFYTKLNKQLIRRNVRSLINKDVKRLQLSLKMTVYLTNLFFITRRPDIQLYVKKTYLK